MKLNIPSHWLACVALTATTPAFAQSFNIDYQALATNAVPAATHGGAAGQVGPWRSIQIAATSAALSDVNNVATTVTISMSATAGTTITSTTNLVGAPPDDSSLLTDVYDPGTGAAGMTWTINNLAAGEYDIYTYGMAPDSNLFRTAVSVAGSPDPLQSIGGVYAGVYALGITHAKHHVTATGGPIVITTVPNATPTTNFVSVAGFQIVNIPPSSGAPFCFGDGIDMSHTTPCPCANIGTAGNGCANSVNAAGGNLTASGSISGDTVVLAASGMPGTVSCIYLQGDALDDATFGDGVRCTGGTLIRLRTRANVGGASTFPDSTDTVTLSQRGGVTIGSGAVRYYQTYYRNSAAAFCPPETFNVTNGWQITW